MPNRVQTEGHENLRKGGPSRRLAWLGVSFSVLIAGILLYSLTNLDKEAEKLRRFCDKTLDGKPVKQVAATAQEFGFDVRELRDTLLVTVAGKRLGQSCFLTIADGNVSEVHSVVTH